MSASIGKIERVKLREVWPKEDADFTPWLRDNIDVLNEAIELTLSSPESEQSAGAFSVDVVAEDENGTPVIIENQLGKSDHTHLGQLVTYLTALDAKVAVWIVADPRPEHVGAIAWLNESSAASFYLVKVEAVKIGGSAPAPLLTLITGPSEEAREVGQKKKELSETGLLRKRFWVELLQRASNRTPLHDGVSPSHRQWCSASVGKAGMNLSYYARRNDGQVHLWIGGRDADGNAGLFSQFEAHRDQIEAAFDGELRWEGPGIRKSQRSCAIVAAIEVGGYADEEKWPQVHDAMIDAMTRLGAALRPHIDKLKV